MEETPVWLGWAVPATLLCLIVTLLYLYGTWTFNTWSSRGISGPKPVPFLGNVLEFNKRGFFVPLREWSKKYGKVYRFFLFRQPVLVTTDLDILKEVFIKYFRNFNRRVMSSQDMCICITRIELAGRRYWEDRNQMLMDRFIPYPANQGLVAVNGEQWKRQRHTLTPTFSTSKLKAMGPFITRCCNNLSDVIREDTKANKLMDVKQVYGSYTLDLISSTAFGFEMNALGHAEDNVFLNAVRDLFAGARPFHIPALVTAIFPFTYPIFKLMGCSNLPQKEVLFITETIRAVIKDRRKTRKNDQTDFLQLMLDAEATQAHISANPQDKCLTTDEIIGQGFTIFIAGYETTSTTLQYLTYLLAMNPDKQDKLYREIVSAVGNEEPNYDNIAGIKYLDDCVHEALRCFPPFPLLGRPAEEERTINGVTIPAGAAVAMSIYGLMKDEDIFPEPDKFLPERWEEDSIPSLVREMAFGIGPRQCIGMRLALYNAKMAIVTVLRKFAFVRVPETPEEVNFKPGQGLAIPEAPILVGTQLREEA